MVPGRVGVTVPLGAGARVRCHVYEGRPPLLDVDTDAASLLFGVFGAEVTDGDVQVARDLLREVGAFVDGIEQERARQVLSAAGVLAGPVPS